MIAGGTLLVFPSEHETFGLPQAEAMAVGTPVLAADTAVSREVCGDAAEYVPPRDVEALVAGLARLLDDGALRARLAAAGRARAARFTWERTAAQTLDVLREAAGT